MDGGIGQPTSEMNGSQHVPEPSAKALEFQELIRMRKEEVRAKTEEKRQESVMVLAERKLRTEQESEEKICGLPNEMWKEIMLRVETPQDVESLWRAFPKFRSISGVSQTHECQLAQVMSLDNLSFLGDLDNNKDENMDNLMIFRTISKGMRNAVDRYLDEDFMKILRGHRQHRYGGLITWPTYLYDMETLDECLARYRDGPVESRAKRFCNRSIFIRTCDISLDPEHLLEFKTKTVSLLEIVGDQIWHATVNLAHHGPPNAEASFMTCYLFLLDSVRLMPNLKWLGLSFHASAKCALSSSALSPVAFANHPFPHLPRLERIELMHFTDFQPKFEILTEVLRPNSHVKILDINRFLEGAETEELKTLLSMLNLDAVTCRNRQTMPYTGNPIPLESLHPLQALISANCNLKDLNISFKTQDGGILLESVFNFVNNFPTLEYLSLSSFGSVTFEERQFPSLVLPNLTSFKLKIRLLEGSIDLSKTENVVFLLSLQFLLHPKRLQNLVWTFFTGTIYNRNGRRKLRKKLRRMMINHEHHEEMINFRGGLRDLKYSNIWEIFPELEHVKTRVLPDNPDEFNEFHRRKFSMLN